MIDELIKAFNVAIEEELRLVHSDLKKAKEKDDEDTMKICLSYAKGLQQSFKIIVTLLRQTETITS